jgi:hypothetical protein
MREPIAKIDLGIDETLKKDLKNLLQYQMTDPLLKLTKK